MRMATDMSSTFDKCRQRGLELGAIVVTPPHNGFTMGRRGRLHFSYVMVRYPDRSVVGYKPELLRPATAEQALAYATKYEGYRDE